MYSNNLKTANLIAKRFCVAHEETGEVSGVGRFYSWSDAHEKAITLEEIYHEEFFVGKIDNNGMFVGKA